MRLLAASLVLAVFASSPVPAADSLSSLHYLVGNWNCTYQAGKTVVYYKAAYTYDVGNNWLRENDSWAHGGSDLGMITYDPRSRKWISTVMDGQRSVVVFHAGGSDPSHLVYHSVYPNAKLTNVFERKSQTRYTLHFSGNMGGQRLKSADVCIKA